MALVILDDLMWHETTKTIQWVERDCVRQRHSTRGVRRERTTLVFNEHNRYRVSLGPGGTTTAYGEMAAERVTFIKHIHSSRILLI